MEKKKLDLNSVYKNSASRMGRGSEEDLVESLKRNEENSVDSDSIFRNWEEDGYDR